jgi:hypothetical protein
MKLGVLYTADFFVIVKLRRAGNNPSHERRKTKVQGEQVELNFKAQGSIRWHWSSGSIRWQLLPYDASSHKTVEERPLPVEYRDPETLVHPDLLDPKEPFGRDRHVLVAYAAHIPGVVSLAM